MLWIHFPGSPLKKSLLRAFETLELKGHNKCQPVVERTHPEQPVKQVVLINLPIISDLFK